MFLIDITHPAAALDHAAQQQVAQAIIDRIIVPGSAPPETLGVARRMTHVLFREAQAWSTGDGPLADNTATPYLVTITVPEAWRTELSGPMIAAVRAALIDHDIATGTERGGGELWVNVIGVADGSIGLNGIATDAPGVGNYLTDEYRRSEPPVADLPDGVLLDPICGMRVLLGPNTATLEHDGQTLAFCSTGCQTIYARNHHLNADPQRR